MRNRSATTAFPVEWCREQFPAFERAVDGQTGRLSRRPGRQPGARARDRRHRPIPDRDERQSRRTFRHQPRERRHARAGPTQAVADLLGVESPRSHDLRRQHDHAHLRLQPGAGPHLAAGRRSDRHPARSRRQRHALGAGRPRRRRDGAPRRHSCRRIARSTWTNFAASFRRARGWWPSAAPRTRSARSIRWPRSAAGRTSGRPGVISTPCTMRRTRLLDVGRLGLRLPGLLGLQVLRAARGHSVGPARAAASPCRPTRCARPADTLPDRWMTGTQNHEGIAGVLAAIEYLADLGRASFARSRRTGALALDRGVWRNRPPTSGSCAGS